MEKKEKDNWLYSTIIFSWLGLTFLCTVLYSNWKKYEKLYNEEWDYGIQTEQTLNQQIDSLKTIIKEYENNGE
jgi:hypothetical protein